MVRGGGQLREATWGEAFAEIARGLPVLGPHGPDASRCTPGSRPTTPRPAALHRRACPALGTRNVFSAASLNSGPARRRRPALRQPVHHARPGRRAHRLRRDDRRQPGRVQRQHAHRARTCAPSCAPLRRRGGRIVVVDPRRTESADGADEHLRDPPGTDALLLLAMLNVLLAEGLVDLGDLAPLSTGWTTSPRWPTASPRSGSRGAPSSTPAASGGSPGSWPRADAGVVYGRIGASTTAFAHRDHLAGRRAQRPHRQPGPAGRGDVPAARARRAAELAADGVTAALHARTAPRSRVSRRPIICGELPAVRPGRGDRHPRFRAIRALITIAGNPARSVPNSERLDAALDSLDLMVSVDTYLNETSRARRRRAAGALDPGATALRPAALQLRLPQRRELLRAGAGPAARHAPGVGDPRPADAGRRRRTRRRRWDSTTGGRGAGRARRRRRPRRSRRAARAGAAARHPAAGGDLRADAGATCSSVPARPGPRRAGAAPA